MFTYACGFRSATQTRSQPELPNQTSHSHVEQTLKYMVSRLGMQHLSENASPIIYMNATFHQHTLCIKA